MAFGERLVALRKERGLTRDTFAEEIGISKYTLRNYELNKNEPGSDFLRIVSDYFDVSIDYLLGTTEEKEKVTKYQLKRSEYDVIEKYRLLRHQEQEDIISILDMLVEKSDMAKELEDESVEFAYFGKIAAAGTFIDSFSMLMKNRIIRVKPDENTSKADICVSVSGDSMNPMYYDGDVLLIKLQSSVEYGDIGIFQCDNGIYVKQYMKDGFKSLNKDYDDLVGEKIICLGKVVGKATVR